MVIDYSQTINRFTQLDVYPLPNINDMVQKIAQYSVFSTIDLRSAYHQIPLKEEDKPYTAFEASGGLYQFNRMPFGITNGVAGFQRSIDDVITKENIKDTFAFVDNVAICGKTQKEHDENLEKFLEAAKKYNMTFNEEKSIFSTDILTLFGSVISKGTIKPDPERLHPLKELPPPQNIAAQRHVIGMFSYYSKWIPKFSEKIRPLIQNKQFPISESALQTFEQLKLDIENSVIYAIDDSIPFEVETDASDYAIAATLNQAGRPVAFFSRTLDPSEQNHSPVEKEAYAIVESLKGWRHFLLGRHFKLITDQRSVTFMYNNKRASKIKNDKIMRWRVELSCFKYDIVYHPGRDNKGPDTFTRMFCASVNDSSLQELHNSLCHPGVTRMYHFVRCRNLPYSVEDIKRMTSACSVCAKLKPRFHRSSGTLIKATQSFEWLNIDFKGPLPSSSKNKYMLTIVDEFSRFPFVFPCQDINSPTVIKCLCQLFAIFGMPSYVHSDRGSSLISEELKQFFNGRGIATSRTSRYNPQGNGQCERYNGIVWKAVTLALKARSLSISQWEEVLPDALHSIRSLLSTATNCMPHERMFTYQRRSSSGNSVLTWLMTPGTVLMKRHVRNSKYDPLVEEVELIESNPEYAYVRYPDGRESTVSLRHLAPCGQPALNQSNIPFNDNVEHRESVSEPAEAPASQCENENVQEHIPTQEPQNEPAAGKSQPEPEQVLRRSERVRRPPDKLNL